MIRARESSSNRYWTLASAPAGINQIRPVKFAAPSEVSSPIHRLPRRSSCKRLLWPPTNAKGTVDPVPPSMPLNATGEA